MPSVNSAQITYVQFQEQGTNPSATPSSGYSYLFFKNDGIYYKNSAGTVTKIGVSTITLNDLTDVNTSGQAKGSMLLKGSSDWVVLNVGANGQIPFADDTQASGVRWDSASSLTSDDDARSLIWLGW